MGVGSITESREVTSGAVHAPQGGAGEAARQIAATGAHAGREAQRTIASGLGDAAKNVGDALKVAGDFAVKTLWEKPIAEAEEKLRELDLECRSKGWRDENGVERPGFDLVRGAEAANIGEQWDAYMARKANKIFDDMGLTAGQREELSRRTAKFRTETRARLTERGTVEAIASNLADIDARAVRSGERNVAGAVENANKDLELANFAAEVSGNAADRDNAIAAADHANAELLSDALVEKRAKLIRDKVIGGLGRKSVEVATAEADKIVRAEALETVKALAAAGHYARARKLVEQGKKLGFDDAALAKGRELVDGMEVNAATAEGLKAYNTVWDENGKRIGGRDQILDAQIATLKRVAENAPKGSRTAIAALQQAERFEDAADSIAYGDLVDGIAGGDPALFDVDKNGKATLKEKPFDKKSQPRAARLWPKAVEAYNAQVSAAKNKATKAANEVEGAEIAKAIANRDPQSYYRWLTERCKDGAYSTDEYKVHEAKFKNTWMSSSQPEFISEMAAIVDSTFGVEFSKWLAVDKNGNKAVNPLTGQSVLAKDAVLPDIPYMVVPDAEVAQLPWWSKFGMDSATAAKSPYRTTLSGADMKEIMDSFLHTWMHNGKDVSEEQLKKEKYIVGGVEFDLSFLYDDEADGKDDKASGRKAGYHRIDAVRDFKRICDRINLGKRSLEMWKNRSDPSLLKEAEKSAMRPAEIKAMGTLKAPYLTW